MDMEQIIERLTKEKSHTLNEHRQEILIKDKRIFQLVQKQKEMEKQNKRLKWRLDEAEYIIQTSTQAIDGLLILLKFDEQIQIKQLSENFPKMCMSHSFRDNKHIISQSIHESQSGNFSQTGKASPLQNSISSLLKVLENMINKLKGIESIEKMNQFLKQQINVMENQQRGIRNQKAVLEMINNESQKSRNQIAQKLKKSIQIALKSDNTQIQFMTIHQLKDKVGLYTVAIKNLNNKINTLEHQLYQTKRQCIQKMQRITYQSGKIKQKSDADSIKKDKQIHILKTCPQRI